MPVGYDIAAGKLRMWSITRDLDRNNLRSTEKGGKIFSLMALHRFFFLICSLKSLEQSCNCGLLLLKLYNTWNGQHLQCCRSKGPIFVVHCVNLVYYSHPVPSDMTSRLSETHSQCLLKAKYLPGGTPRPSPQTEGCNSCLGCYTYLKN